MDEDVIHIGKDDDGEKEKKVDKLGRVRPSTYKKHHGQSKKTKVVKTEKDMLTDLKYEDTLDEVHAQNENTEVFETEKDMPTDFNYENLLEEDHGQLNSTTSSHFNFCTLIDQIIENKSNEFNNTDEDQGNDHLISDEKWEELTHQNHEIDDKNNEFQENEFSEVNSNQQFEDENPIYPGHSMTVYTSMVLILLYATCHSISGAQLTDLLTLIGAHCLTSHPGLKSVYMFKSYFANLKSPLKKHYFCKYCMTNVNENDDICPSEKCGENIRLAKKKHYFIEVPLEKQLENILKRDETISLLKERFVRKKKKTNGIEDIYDGSIYKTFSCPEGPLSSDFPNNISFTWNTDGIPVFKSSQFSLWPMYLVINELPYKKRMLKENMILCGLWFGELKPFMSLYTKPLMKSLKNLESNGICYKVGGNNITTRAFLICGTADLPAKSLVLNCNQFNGQFSCTRCMHPGETFKTQKGGSVHIFPYDASQPMHEERTKETCVRDALTATESRKTTNGIKGPSFLMTLKSYDYVRSTSIDYMHGTLLGISKLLIKLWISSPYSKENFSIANHVEIIDNRLLELKPPSFITRCPRSLSDHFKYWKTSELRSWLFYYSLPILCDILSEDYFIHYACFVQGIFLLSTDCITQEDISRSFSLLSYFVHMFPTLYGERFVTLNMHSLLHLPQCVQDLGPLWVYSCFPFENVNGDLMELYHGTQNVEIQIMSSLNIVQNMPYMLENLYMKIDQGLKSFVDRISRKHSFQKGLLGTSSGSYPVGASSLNLILTDDLYGKLVTEAKFKPTKILTYKRVSLRGFILHSEAYTRVHVRNTYTVKYFENTENQIHYGSISYFILAKNCNCEKELCLCHSALLAVIRKLRNTGQSIVSPNFLTVDVPHIIVSKKTNIVNIVDVGRIMNVVVYISFDNDSGKVFLCDVPNVKESD